MTEARVASGATGGAGAGRKWAEKTGRLVTQVDVSHMMKPSQISSLPETFTKENSLCRFQLPSQKGNFQSCSCVYSFSKQPV